LQNNIGNIFDLIKTGRQFQTDYQDVCFNRTSCALAKNVPRNITD
jgi:hypothetical protein